MPALTRGGRFGYPERITIETDTKRRISSLSLLAGALLLVVIGPDWPARKTALICGPSPETMVEKSVLPDMEVCMFAESQAFESGAKCFCSVKEDRFAPLYWGACAAHVRDR